ncbi:MAG: hypothetical protein IT301_05265, partial [Dehalococcoidia bacterium]|nr:hypothetical protein [Dehalococcoidia bacterium]
MATLTVYSDAADDFVRSSDATYATARSGSGTLDLGSAVEGNELWIGQRLLFVYYLQETFLSFDTSPLGAGATVSAVSLNLDGIDDHSDTDFTAEARLFDSGATVTTGDWVAGASLSALTRVATFATSGGWGTGYNTFTEDGTNFQTGVNLTGPTRLVLVSDRVVAGTSPAADEYVRAWPAEWDGTTEDPNLVITYTAPPPTRFYFSATNSAPVSPGFAAWSRTTEGVRRLMSPTKDGST